MRKMGVMLAACLGGMLAWSHLVLALDFPLAPDRVPDVSNTRHNFSVDGPAPLKTNEPRNVVSTNQKEVCVFCHIPHAAAANVGNPRPLWARDAIETAGGAVTYTLYASGSTDATLAQPGNASKMCLSCHDGTLSVATVGSMT
ncbi:MAG: hypothetical protein OEW58_07800, partial [Gammaproteobacteria bacterium]|nr:hypothetical protein [Gammaproteobacteria bacterium]